MSKSTAESGHAVNISNYKLLIDACTGFGADYQPSNEALLLPAMTGQWTAGGTANAALSKAEADMKQPINEREAIFEPLGKLVTRVVGALNSSKASEAVKKDAKSIADRIRGMNRSKKSKAESTEGGVVLATVSTSQQSYVQRTSALLDLVNLLKTAKEYKPNEEPLKVVSLAALQVQMQEANDGIGAILTAGANALLARDRTLYKPDSGMVDVAQNCRDYVKSVFGSQSAEYKRVTAIKFRDLPKKELARL